MSKKIRSAAISPVQRKVGAGHFPEAERALEVVFRELRAKEEHREEELREAIRRSRQFTSGKTGAADFRPAAEGLSQRRLIPLIPFLLEMGQLRETVETAPEVANVLATRINTG